MTHLRDGGINRLGPKPRNTAGAHRNQIDKEIIAAANIRLGGLLSPLRKHAALTDYLALTRFSLEGIYRSTQRLVRQASHNFRVDARRADPGVPTVAFSHLPELMRLIHDPTVRWLEPLLTRSQ